MPSRLSWRRSVHFKHNHYMTTKLNPESPENFEQKCCCALVLDVSYSMSGEPIDQLNKGIQAFYTDISSDSTTANRLEVAVVEFSDTVYTTVPASLVSNFTMPLLTVKGSTKLVDGVREGIRIVNERKQYYKQTGQPYYRPWVILITDGAPDAGQDVQGLSQEIRAGMAAKGFNFLAIGVASADMALLKQISDPAMEPAQLQGLKFSEFFKWLSASMSAITNSATNQKIDMPNPQGWMNGYTV